MSCDSSFWMDTLYLNYIIFRLLKFYYHKYVSRSQQTWFGGTEVNIPL